jgi:hypothetical protein
VSKHLARRSQLSQAIPLNPGDLAVAIEAELATLAEIDAGYAAELQRLEHSTGSTHVRQHRAKQIEALHRHDREPHVQHLAKLHQQRMALATFPVQRPLH